MLNWSMASPFPAFLLSSPRLNSNIYKERRQGRWWLGSRQRTIDGMKAHSGAAVFFKSIEEGDMEEVVGVLGKAYR